MAAKKDRILWADDEIDLLKPHILFLQDKGYEVVPVVSGQDAIDYCREQTFDIIFLDENMPGLTGLETLVFIKEIAPSIPVVMVTKSEEESIMNQAIGNKIADYLIKPLEDLAVLEHSVRRALDRARLLAENQRLQDSLPARVAGGTAQAGDLLVAQQEALTLTDRRDDLQRDRAKARAALRRWVGSRADEALQGDPGPLTRPVAQLRTELANHAELELYPAMQSMARAESREAQSETRGDWAYTVAEHSLLVEEIHRRCDPDGDPRWRLAALASPGALDTFIIGITIFRRTWCPLGSRCNRRRGVE